VPEQEELVSCDGTGCPNAEKTSNGGGKTLKKIAENTTLADFLTVSGEKSKKIACFPRCDAAIGA
jgi:hypothetical protein